MLVHGLHPCSDVPKAARLSGAVPGLVGFGVRYASDLSAGTRMEQPESGRSWKRPMSQIGRKQMVPA